MASETAFGRHCRRNVMTVSAVTGHQSFVLFDNGMK